MLNINIFYEKSSRGKDVIVDWDSWSQYGFSTNNSLESFNRTCNKMNEVSLNIWKIFESFKRVDAETHILLSNAVGHDLCGNTGRKAGSLSRKLRIKCILQQYSSFELNN